MCYYQQPMNKRPQEKKEFFIKPAPTESSIKQQCSNNFATNNMKCDSMRPGPQKNLCTSQQIRTHSECMSDAKKYGSKK